ncbi:hypothetical protein AJ85_12580 [Alkalihalobacillus alcalophilus ATCC 27647 = CGMCC 1.3604]|uniref:Uncharacterized protein n=1 Tax=Alkalihalobacillus alcalophilus ATCC 27647 = CGMCC 1.3604 TaxID=1218173 RepID=A0A4S4JT55_ALKAL|nr:hypothetical protein AJ85_12580 [Alkalihalobacillus alcalophilus ATCC 27647 = CGMCC 1.3604]
MAVLTVGKSRYGENGHFLRMELKSTSKEKIHP